MCKKILLGALLGGLTVWVWQSISHMALPWHYTAFSQFKEPAKVETALKENAEGSGMFMIPWADLKDEEAMQKAHEQSATGLFVFASVRPQGGIHFGSNLGQQFLWNALAAALVTFILCQFKEAGMGCRIGVVLFFALFSVFTTVAPNWTWWGFGNQFTLVGIADMVIGWLLAGVVLAKLTLPKPEDSAGDDEPAEAEGN